MQYPVFLSTFEVFRKFYFFSPEGQFSLRNTHFQIRFVSFVAPVFSDCAPLLHNYVFDFVHPAFVALRLHPFMFSLLRPFLKTCQRVCASVIVCTILRCIVDFEFHRTSTRLFLAQTNSLCDNSDALRVVQAVTRLTVYRLL